MGSKYWRQYSKHLSLVKRGFLGEANQMTELNVGIIGLGHMGLLHIMNCLHIDDVRVVAACDQSEGALKRAKSLGIDNVYTDYRSLLEKPDGLDAVVISLPNFLHYESTMMALKSGLNVFVEKPMAVNVKESLEIAELAEKTGTKFMVGHCMRFIDAIQKMKASLERGNIGDLVAITIEEVYNGPFTHPLVPKPVPNWWFDPKKSGGGVLLDIGYHLIDLFRFFGGDAQVIFSCLGRRFNLPIEDDALVILRSSNQVKGIINVGWYQKLVFPKYNFRLILHGNAGYLSTEEIAPRNLYAHAITEGTKNIFRILVGRRIRPLSYTYYYEAYYRELKHFFDCIKTDIKPSVSVFDGLKAVQIIEEVYNLYRKNFDINGE